MTENRAYHDTITTAGFDYAPYRAKSKHHSSWVYGWLLNGDKDCFIGNSFRMHRADETKCEVTGQLVKEETVCRSTGRRDKDNQMIWENDIVQCVDDGHVFLRQVVWDSEELDFKGTNGKENYRHNFTYLTCCEEVKKVGNIYDNPELVKQLTYDPRTKDFDYDER